MREPRGPLFLGRGSYRQRRLADAARFLPVLGAVLLMLPLIWPRAGDAQAIATSTAMYYVFGCWMALVAASLILAWWLDPTATEPKGEDDPVRGG